MNRQRITAIILAAGYSSRMGRFKPLLEIGGRTMMERSVSLFRNAGINDIRVVIGHCRDQIEPVLEKIGIQTIVNHANTHEMFSSVLAALDNPESHIQAIILLPVDIPLIRPWTIQYLMECNSRHSGRILIPCFQNQQGHPVVIPSDCFSMIRKWNGKNGLKGALNLMAEKIIKIPVADANILFDVDTPSDFEESQKRWSRYTIPTRRECEAILRDIVCVNEDIYAHCSAVADMAAKISDDLNRAGFSIDRELAVAAGLVHDLAKGKPQHARRAAAVITGMGFPEVADIVAAHTDIEYSPQAPVNCAEVLYLADKLVKGNQVVDLKTRFQAGLKKYSHDPEIKKKIEKRMHDAEMIRNKIEAMIGKPM
jgi:CTP:molybdopterin cytidylyltransferase MocA/HD superfamily phosphohydrolase YqeK